MTGRGHGARAAEVDLVLEEGEQLAADVQLAHGHAGVGDLERGQVGDQHAPVRTASAGVGPDPDGEVVRLGGAGRRAGRSRRERSAAVAVHAFVNDLASDDRVQYAAVLQH